MFPTPNSVFLLALAGHIPPELGTLSELRSLNKLTGTKLLYVKIGHTDESRVWIPCLRGRQLRTRPLIVGEIHTLELAVGETLSNSCGLTVQLVVTKVELLQC